MADAMEYSDSVAVAESHSSAYTRYLASADLVRTGMRASNSDDSSESDVPAEVSSDNDAIAQSTAIIMTPDGTDSEPGENMQIDASDSSEAEVDFMVHDSTGREIPFETSPGLVTDNATDAQNNQKSKLAEEQERTAEQELYKFFPARVVQVIESLRRLENKRHRGSSNNQAAGTNGQGIMGPGSLEYVFNNNVNCTARPRMTYDTTMAGCNKSEQHIYTVISNRADSERCCSLNDSASPTATATGSAWDAGTDFLGNFASRHAANIRILVFARQTIQKDYLSHISSHGDQQQQQQQQQQRVHPNISNKTRIGGNVGKADFEFDERGLLTFTYDLHSSYIGCERGDISARRAPVHNSAFEFGGGKVKVEIRGKRAWEYEAEEGGFFS